MTQEGANPGRKPTRILVRRMMMSSHLFMTDCRGSHFSVGGVARGFLDKHVFVHCACLANYILGVDLSSQVVLLS